jgi:hypothetical protein
MKFLQPTHGLAVGLGGMFWGEPLAFVQVAHGDAGVFDVSTARKTGHFDGGSRRITPNSNG